MNEVRIIGVFVEHRFPSVGGISLPVGSYRDTVDWHVVLRIRDYTGKESLHRAFKPMVLQYRAESCKSLKTLIVVIDVELLL